MAIGTLTTKQILLMVFLLMGLPGLLSAGTGRGLRCGSDLVSPGYLKFEVLQTCGEPISREMVGEVEISDGDSLYDRRFGRFRSQGASRVILYIEEWIYDKGGLHVLRFDGNRLVNVESVRRK